MIYPELRHIVSDLVPPALPADPTDCAVRFQAWIGPLGGAGEEAFAFTVATPAYLVRELGPCWGRGYLLIEAFEWSVMGQALARLLAHCARPSWDEVTAELNKELHWEFDSYREPEA